MAPKPTTAAVLVITCLTVPLVGAAPPQRTVDRGWTFDRPGDLQGWTPNGELRNVEARADGLYFEATGSDPILQSPLFDPVRADNSQYLALVLASDGEGEGEIYFTNKTEGRYGGFEPAWRIPFRVKRCADMGQTQTVVAYPFWQDLGKIIHLRIDPPSGVRIRLVAVRIMRLTLPQTAVYEWPSCDTWLPLGDIERAPRRKAWVCKTSQGLLMTPVTPFEASDRPILHATTLDRAEPFAFYWASSASTGIQGIAVPVFGQPTRDLAAHADFDLRACPAWKGTITHIGVGPMTASPLEIHRVALDPAEPDRQLVQRWFGPVELLPRAGKKMTMRLTLENVSDRETTPAKLKLNPHEPGPAVTATVPVVAPGNRTNVEWTIDHAPQSAPADFVAGTRTLVQANGRRDTVYAYSTQATIAPALEAPPADYVPGPRPVESDYDIGVYYFPGWSPDQASRWQLQKDYPERDSLLGWYREGDPEVADWHIKWAVENGIRFFIYDWYWRDGKVALEHALHDGFLKARYRNRIRFCVMWANHAPYANHSKAQLLQVTDYWIEHYFRRPNYYRIDDRPYVSFFSPGELLKCLGTEDAVHDAFDAMRARVRDAGLGNPYFVACGPFNDGSQKSFQRMGFDALTGYNYPAAGATTPRSPYELFIRAHEPIWHAAREAGVIAYIPVLTAGWDSRPWHHEKAMVRFGRTTRNLEQGLQHLKAFLDETHSRVAILEAWNEWGEGSYIEPNREFGFADLEAVRRTFARPGDWPTNIGPQDVGLGPYDIRH
jgi:hypothetical protein